MKSPTDGCPIGPRSCLSWASSWSRATGETRAVRRSATLDSPRRRTMLFHERAATVSNPLDQIRGERRQVRGDALVEQTLTVVRSELLELLSSPQMVVGHAPQATPRRWTGRPTSRRYLSSTSSGDTAPWVPSLRAYVAIRRPDRSWPDLELLRQRASHGLAAVDIRRARTRDLTQDPNCSRRQGPDPRSGPSTGIGAGQRTGRNVSNGPMESPKR